MRNLILASILSLFLAVSLTSCSDDPISGGQNDTSGVVRFNNLVVNEWFNQNSNSVINLFAGQVTNQNNNSNWDIKLIDSNGTSANFRFRDGDLGDDPLPGFTTRFGFGSSNMTQAQFDSLAQIPDDDGTLEAKDFPASSTDQINGGFNHPLSANRVYSFYLVGRDNAGQNSGTPIYGMIRLDGSALVGGEKQFTVDVKINVKGRNQFVETLPISVNP
jgi:hypothetical protein